MHSRQERILRAELIHVLYKKQMSQQWMYWCLWVKHTVTYTHTLLQSQLRALDSCVQSGAEACYLQAGGGQV